MQVKWYTPLLEIRLQHHSQSLALSMAGVQERFACLLQCCWGNLHTHLYTSMVHFRSVQLRIEDRLATT